MEVITIDQNKSNNVDIDFLLIRKLLRKYQNTHQSTVTTIKSHFMVEVIRKVEQVKFLISKVKSTEKKLRYNLDYKNPQMMPGETRPINKRQYNIEERLGREIQVYTESCYYFAWRLIVVVRLLLGKKSFDVKCIRDIRNLLIEHPEKGNSMITSQSFGYIGPNGPVVKPARNSFESKVVLDKGLYLNIKELTEKIIELIKRQ